MQQYGFTREKTRRIILNALHEEPDWESAEQRIESELKRYFRHAALTESCGGTCYIRVCAYVSDSDSLWEDFNIIDPFRNWTAGRLHNTIKTICERFSAEQQNEADQEIRKLRSFDYMTHNGEPFTTRIYVFMLPNHDRIKFGWDFEAKRFVIDGDIEPCLNRRRCSDAGKRNVRPEVQGQDREDVP